MAGHKDATSFGVIAMADPEGDKGKYVGPLDSKGKAQGYGMLKYHDGSVFIGTFSSGVMRDGVCYNARGKVWYTRASSKGTDHVHPQIVNAYPLDSFGEARTSDCDGDEGTFIGPLERGKPHGQGMLQYDDGFVFLGEFSMGSLRRGACYDNLGVLVGTMNAGVWSATGSSDKAIAQEFPCKKSWAGSHQEMYGSMRIADNDGDEGLYTGPFNEDGQAHGCGRLAYDDGYSFVGSFSEGALFEGVLTEPGGKVTHTMSQCEWGQHADSLISHKYQSFKCETRARIYTMYHGTSATTAAAILKEGFRWSCTGELGPGIYLVDDSNVGKAKRFAHDDAQRSKGTEWESGRNEPVLIECDVEILNSFVVPASDASWPAKGYDACRASQTHVSATSEWCVRSAKQIRVKRVLDLKGDGCPWNGHCPYEQKTRMPGSPWGGKCPCRT